MRVRIKGVSIGSTGDLSGFLVSMEHTKTYPRNGDPLYLYDVTICIDESPRTTIHIEGGPERSSEKTNSKA